MKWSLALQNRNAATQRISLSDKTLNRLGGRESQSLTLRVGMKLVELASGAAWLMNSKI